MQYHLALTTFEYQNNRPIRTVMIDGAPWFYATDLCRILDLSYPTEALRSLEDDEKLTLSNAKDQTGHGEAQSYNLISESGLYALIFKSRKPEAKVFRRWVTSEVLPKIRKTGAFSLMRGTPAFIQRFNANWDRVEQGYFSVISGFAIWVYGRFEQVGYILPDRAPDGKEIRPDVSVGRTFADWLSTHHPTISDKWKTYIHKFLDGSERDGVRQYENTVLPHYIQFLETVWLKEHAPSYFQKRDAAALQYLPKLLPAPTVAALPPKPAPVVPRKKGASRLREIRNKLK
jgi:prophage antirepressor-like protein